MTFGGKVQRLPIGVHKREVFVKASVHESCQLLDVDELAEEDDMAEVSDVLTEITGLADDAEIVPLDNTPVQDSLTDNPMAALAAGFEDVVIEDVKKEV